MSFRGNRNDKADSTTTQIVAALRAAGAEVHYGRPLDLWIGYKRKWVALEVKSANGVLSEEQKGLLYEMDRLGLPAFVVRTEKEALVAIGAIRK